MIYLKLFATFAVIRLVLHQMRAMQDKGLFEPSSRMKFWLGLTVILTRVGLIGSLLGFIWQL